MEFVKYLEDTYKKSHKLPDVISFDHDLDTEHYNSDMYSSNAQDYDRHYKHFKHNTGLDCAKWLTSFCVDKGIRLPLINVHSMNPVGAQNICYELMNCSLFYFEEELIITPRPYNMGCEVDIENQ